MHGQQTTEGTGAQGAAGETVATPTRGDTRERGTAETIEPGVAHVEIAPGEPTETEGHGLLQVADDEEGQRTSR